MSGATARSRLVEVAQAAQAAGVAATRAARLGERLSHRPAPCPSFEAAKSWPIWPGLIDAERERVWQIAALVAARDALPDLIDGEALRAYATPVGERAFEAVLALAPGGRTPLGPPETLGERGRAIAHRALPPMLAETLGVAPGTSPAAANDVAQAERIAQATRP